MDKLTALAILADVCQKAHGNPSSFEKCASLQCKERTKALGILRYAAGTDTHHCGGDQRAGGNPILGPLQGMWDAWTPVQPQVVAKPSTHFQQTIAIQFAEINEQQVLGDAHHAAKEVVDIISVCLNWLRWMGWRTPQQVADLMCERAKRYDGQAQAILDKYHAKYGI